MQDFNSALAAGATLISLAAVFLIAERFFQRLQKGQTSLYLACWAAALVLFAGGTGMLWAGTALGWNIALFRAFYLLGGALSVLFLGMGSVFLFARKETSTKIFWGCCIFSALVIGVVWAAPAKGSIVSEHLPQGSEVFGPLPRILIAFSSSLGALVVFSVAIFSIWKLSRAKNAQASEKAHQIWGASLVAAGTLVLSLGGIFNSVANETTVFSVSILLGIAGLTAGFLASDSAGRTSELKNTAG